MNESFTVKERIIYAGLAFCLILAISGMAFGYDLVSLFGVASAFVVGVLLPSPIKMEIK